MERNPNDATNRSTESLLSATGRTTKSQATAFDPRDLVPEPIFCCDADGHFVWVNHAAEKLTGYSTVQLLGQPFSMLIAPSRRHRLTAFFVGRHRREEVETERDVPILTREGRTVWVGARVRRVRTLHGRLGYVACAHDLHGIVFEIERLKREARELEARAAEAMAAARLKGDFLTAMSQEIRSPMDALLGMTRLLLESNLDRDQRTFSEVIQSAGEQLLQLVTDILDFSRIEAGKLEVASLDFDVRVTMDGVGPRLAPLAHSRSIVLSRHVHHDVPSHLKGDPGRLRQVLAHLLRCLLQSMDRGEISVWATLVEETAHGVTLRFSVSYSGHTPSLDLDELLRVFGTDPGKSRRMDAEALGMAISRQLVTLMGGQAGVETQAGGGSIWFQLPFSRHERTAPAAPLPEVELSGMRVLVADASMGMRMALTGMLSSWNCIADEAEDGESALTRMREAAREGRPYRVALVDMQLPGLDGEALARAIRADASLDDMLLMAVTGVGRRGDAGRAQEVGYTAYLVKPFEPSYLYDALIETVHRGAPSPEQTLEGPAPEIVTRHSVAERRRQRLRILVVEDNPVNQLVAVAALRRSGYQPETAASASEAIQAHALHRFDLIFMDLELPDLNGIEATEEIHRMEVGTGRKTPVVAVTGHDQPEVHKKCLAVGMKEVLVKPLNLDAMCAGIDRWTQPEMGGSPWVAQAEIVGAEPSSSSPDPAVACGASPVESAGPADDVPQIVPQEHGEEREGAVAETAPDPGFTGGVATTAPSDTVSLEGSELGALPVVSLADHAEGVAPGMVATPSSVKEGGEIELPAGTMGSPATPAVPGSPPATGTARIVELRPAGSAMQRHPDSGDPILDEARLESSSMGNPELKGILIRTFVNHIGPRLQRLREVAAAGDARAVEFEAHGLKGMCATIGAAACADAFARVERLGREKRLEPVAPMLDYAEVEVSRVEALIGSKAKAA